MVGLIRRPLPEYGMPFTGARPILMSMSRNTQEPSKHCSDFKLQRDSKKSRRNISK